MAVDLLLTKFNRKEKRRKKIGTVLKIMAGTMVWTLIGWTILVLLVLLVRVLWKTTVSFF